MGCLEIIPAKEDTCQQQGCAQARIKHSDEALWGKTRSPQRNPPYYHHRHDEKGFPVKEFQEKLPFLLIA